MINTTSKRSLAIAVFCTMLPASWAFAQGVQRSPASLTMQGPGEGEGMKWRLLTFAGFALPTVSVATSSATAPDLSRYREFQLGMDLSDVVKRIGMTLPDARMIHQRPAVIQEMEWRPVRLIGSSPKAEVESVKQILFSFYNRELFRMVVHYDSYETDGLTAEDMIEALSAQYGTATRPVAEITFQYEEKQKVLARWEDAQYTFNLVRSDYSPSFTMVASSKRLDSLAQAAIADAGRLDRQEAPQRELDRQKKSEDERRAQQEKARLANKARFRP